MYLARGRSDEAIELLERASALAPDHEAVHSTLGMAYLQQGRNQDALKTLTLVRRLYPRNWIAPLGLGLLHGGAGQSAEARRLIEESFRVGGDAARAEAANYPLARQLTGEAR
jgi:Flp pilus assembly protein TadD